VLLRRRGWPGKRKEKKEVDATASRSQACTRGLEALFHEKKGEGFIEVRKTLANNNTVGGRVRERGPSMSGGITPNVWESAEAPNLHQEGELLLPRTKKGRKKRYEITKTDLWNARALGKRGEQQSLLQ